MNIPYDVAVIGGGAAGMAAAIRAAEKGKKTLLLERNPIAGKKLAATGNGRCNLLNTGMLRYYGDPSFAQKVLECCGESTQRAFWHRIGVLLTEESQGRVYPMTLQASTVTDALKRAINRTGVRIMTNTEVNDILVKDDGIFFLRTVLNNSIPAHRVIVAAGSSASPRLGGSDSGTRLLSGTGHRIIPFVPALCGLLTDHKSVSGLDGLRVHGTIVVKKGDRQLHQETGEILFSENGISGICVMQCARFVSVENADLAELDLAPETLQDNSLLREEFLYRLNRFPDETPESLLTGILPGRLGFAVCKQAGMAMRGEKIKTLEPQDIDRLLQSMRRYKLRITGVRGLDNAQVAAGGADCAEFDPETMQSRICPGLYAAGEVLNVDGDCGGFNLMFAFGSGLLAGEKAAE